MYSEIEIAAKLVSGALENAFWKFHDLGEAGLQEVASPNRFGEKAFRADVECEEAVLDFLRRSTVSVRVRSEEHGVTNIGGLEPDYYGILDGIDGSYVLKRNRANGKYGTMFGIFKGADPRYDDYLACGIMQHATGRMYLGVKGQGAFVSHWPDRNQIFTSRLVTFDKYSQIYIDESSEINRQAFSSKLVGYHTEFLMCSCLYYANMADGLASFVLECTRKDNLELMVARGIIAEARGVMVDLDGNDIGPQKYLEFGQGEGNHIPIITAANQELADQMVSFLKSR